MKLRNKKTGEIAEIRLKLNESLPDGIRRTIEEAGWEETREPLIKDEKIRKAVKAWAEAIGTTSAFVEKGSFDNEHLELSDALNRICFVAKRPKDIKPGIRYTIAELCGEEEE